jgi:hypothetical protein
MILPVPLHHLLLLLKLLLYLVELGKGLTQGAFRRHHCTRLLDGFWRLVLLLAGFGWLGEYELITNCGEQVPHWIEVMDALDPGADARWLAGLV